MPIVRGEHDIDVKTLLFASENLVDEVSGAGGTSTAPASEG